MKYSKDDQVIAFSRQMMERVEGLPGVRSAAITSELPVTSNNNTDWVRIVGRPWNGIHITANERHVSAGFFSTIEARRRSGRYFTDAEDESRPKVVVINHTFARKFFPNEDPIGRQIGDLQLSPSSIKQIIGVVEDYKDSSLDEEQNSAVYYPFNQNTNSYFSLMVRTSQDEQTILPTLAGYDPSARCRCGSREWIDHDDEYQYLPDCLASPVHSVALVGGFAALAALVLGVVGLYGVIAYSVSQRTREIGVRMALGAQKTAVCRLILREASGLIALGVIVGLAGSVAAAVLMRKLLFGVRAWDVSTLAGGRDCAGKVPRCWRATSRRVEPPGSILWKRCVRSK